MTDPIAPTCIDRSPCRPIARSGRRAGIAARAAAGLLAALCTLPAAAQQQDLDLGEPSVLSQRGQRLKLALPFGSAPGERVSATRFEVVSVSAPAGWQAPDAASFTVAKAARRNVVFLQSQDPTDVPELTVVVRVAGQAGEPQAWTIAVPPARASMTPASYESGAASTGRPSAKASGRNARRTTAAPAR